MKKISYVSLTLYKWWKIHPFEHIDSIFNVDDFAIPNVGDFITWHRERDDSTFFLRVKSRNWTYKDNGNLELEIVCVGSKS